MTELTTTNAYSLLAREYYDSERHPTCANFREASAILFKRLTPAVAPAGAWVVGAGDSLLAATYRERGDDVHGLTITDDSAEMLAHSQRHGDAGATMRIARADALPVDDASLALVAASLADPYDDESFWRETARVLRPGGYALATTPSWEWASRFRSTEGSLDTALFELADGRKIEVPSIVRPVDHQRELISASGFDLERMDSVTLGMIDGPVSPKLGALAEDDPVVVGYLAVRSDSPSAG
jgi:SAM-dependent methyltransferase